MPTWKLSLCNIAGSNRREPRSPDIDPRAAHANAASTQNPTQPVPEIDARTTSASGSSTRGVGLPKQHNLTTSSTAQALALLAHPLSLGALALLLVNDHLLRRLWPSWLTGKLGDLAWLFFAPLALAVVLAWVEDRIMPHNRRGSTARLAFPIAFSLVGLVFTLVKTLPAAHGLAWSGLEALLGAPPALVRDPSDLLALPALGCAWWLWRLSVRPSENVPVRQGRAARGLVALPLAALLTLANAAMPDPGIQCFTLGDGVVYANAGYTSFRSGDGGLTWVFEPNNQPACAEYVDPDQWHAVAGLPDDAGVSYRYRPNAAIQISTDGGATWQTAFDLEPASEAEQMYYLRSRPGNTVYQPGPLDADYDPASGNVLFAMGHQGVLVRQSSGKWTWSMGGQYQRVITFPTADAFSLLLGGMIPLAVGAALLVFATLALRWTLHPLRTVALVLAWIAFLLVTFVFPPPLSNGYTQIATTLGTVGGAVLILPLGVEQAVRLAQRVPDRLPRIALTALAAGLLYFLPFVLWLYNVLPSLTLAAILALVLAGAALAAGWMMYNRGVQDRLPAGG